MIKVRMMQRNDLNQVAQIEKEIFSMPWSEKAFAESLENKDTIYIVAEEDSCILGYCGMYVSFDEGNITNVAVSSIYRRKGVGEKMLSYVFDKAKERGVGNIILEVRETNVAAIELYRKMGFEEAGIRKNFYEFPVENALIMWKHNL